MSVTYKCIADTHFKLTEQVNILVPMLESLNVAAAGCASFLSARCHFLTVGSVGWWAGGLVGCWAASLSSFLSVFQTTDDPARAPEE